MSVNSSVTNVLDLYTPPHRLPSGSLVQAKAWGGCVTRPCGAQTVLAESPPALGLNEAAQRG